MMSQVIQKETMVFLMAAGHGAMLALIYDFLRALRRVIPHSMSAVSAEDFLFWIAAGFLTFCLLFLETDGEIRGYVAVGIALGTALYLQIFSTYVRTVLTAVFGFWRDMFKVLCFPVRKLSGFLARIREKLFRSAVVFWRKMRKKSCHSGIQGNSSKNFDETVGKTKKRIEFPVKKVYNKKKCAENRRKKAGVHMHRQYERGSLDEPGRQKKSCKQEQPQRNAGYRRCGSFFAGGGAGSESETDREESCISGTESRTGAADQG